MIIQAKIPQLYIAETPAPTKTLGPGDVADDGSIYLGVYDDQDWFVTAKDAMDGQGNRLTMYFNEAVEYAKNLRAHGHDDWQLPPSDCLIGDTADILQEMYFKKRKGAFRDTFDERCTVASGLYHANWRRKPRKVHVCSLREFAQGSIYAYEQQQEGSVRCVRAVPRKATP